MLRAMKSNARSAMASQFGSSRRILALTRAPIISPFQSANTLSSSPGRTRPERPRSNAARNCESRASSASLRGTVLRRFQNIVAFEIAFVAHVVVPGKEFAVIRSKKFEDLALRPDIKLALFAF